MCSCAPRSLTPEYAHSRPCARPTNWLTFSRLPHAMSFASSVARAPQLDKDHYENIYCVLKGEKIFTLFPPHELPFLYETTVRSGRYVYSNSCHQLNADGHPQQANHSATCNQHGADDGVASATDCHGDDCSSSSDSHRGIGGSSEVHANQNDKPCESEEHRDGRSSSNTPDGFRVSRIFFAPFFCCCLWLCVRVRVRF
jgi:hypothetical protein